MDPPTSSTPHKQQQLPITQTRNQPDSLQPSLAPSDMKSIDIDPYTSQDFDSQSSITGYARNPYGVNPYSVKSHENNPYGLNPYQIDSSKPYQYREKEIHPYSANDGDPSPQSSSENIQVRQMTRNSKITPIDELDFGLRVSRMLNCSLESQIVQKATARSRDSDNFERFTVYETLSIERNFEGSNDVDLEDSLANFFESTFSLDSLRDVAQFAMTLNSRLTENDALKRLKKALQKEVLRMVQSNFDLYYWANRFQEAQKEEQSYVKNVSLTQLADDFTTFSSLYAKTIVQEQGLPGHLRSIDAVSVGGVAGGSKFITCSILFKFPNDNELEEGYFLYAGRADQGDDELAMKAAANELMAANEYSKSLPPNYSVPMQCMVDFMGFRMIAMPLLPISNSSIVYGSNDGMVHVFCDPDVHEVMKITAKTLHLAEHPVKGMKDEEIRLLCSAGDVEVHADEQGFYYILDLARVFPPIEPIVCNEEYGMHSNFNSIFYRTFRPEFLQVLAEKNELHPVSSDAFSGWGSIYQDHYNQDASTASEELIYIVIPQLAREINELGEDLANHDIIEHFHEKGVNAHFLGAVCQLCDNVNVVRLLNVEMFKRTLKNLLRRYLRAIQKLKHDWVSPFSVKLTLINFLNCICGTSDSLGGTLSDIDVMEDATKRMQHHFGDSTSEKHVDLARLIHNNCVEVILRVLRDCGVVLTDKSLKSFKTVGMGFNFSVADIKSFESQTTSLVLLRRSQARYLFDRSEKLGRSSQEQFRLRYRAVDTFEESSSDPDNTTLLEIFMLPFKEAQHRLCRVTGNAAIFIMECFTRCLYEDGAIQLLSSNTVALALDYWDRDMYFLLSKVFAHYALYLESNNGSWKQIICAKVGNRIIENSLTMLNEILDVDDDIDTLVMYLIAFLSFIDGLASQEALHEIKVFVECVESSFCDDVTNHLNMVLTLVQDRCCRNMLVNITPADVFGSTINSLYDIEPGDQHVPFFVDRNALDRYQFTSDQWEALGRVLVLSGVSDLRHVLCNFHPVCSRITHEQSFPAEFIVIAFLRFILRCSLLEQLLQTRSWNNAECIHRYIMEDIDTLERWDGVASKTILETFLLDNTQVEGLPFSREVPLNVINVLSKIKGQSIGSGQVGAEDFIMLEEGQAQWFEFTESMQNVATDCLEGDRMDRRLTYFTNLEDLMTCMLKNMEKDEVELIRRVLDMQTYWNYDNFPGLRGTMSKNIQNCSSYLLYKISNLDIRDQKGNTILSIAAKRGDFELVETLLLSEKEISVDGLTSTGETPLMKAAEGGFLEVATILVQHNANIDILSHNRNQSPLINAGKNGHISVVEFLFENCADLNLRTLNGTALVHAAQNGHLDVVNFLLERDSSVDIPCAARGETALMKASGNNHLEITTLLLNHGADVNRRSFTGETALIKAAEAGNAKVIEELLKFGAEKDLCSNYGTALMNAAAAGHRKTVEILLETNCDVNRMNFKNKHTALLSATYSGHSDIVKLLVQENADLEARTSQGYTALILAVERQDYDTVLEILESGANIDAATDEGVTPLMWAAARGYLNIVKLLVELGAKPDIVDKQNFTAEDWASAHLHSEVESYLDDIMNPHNQELLDLKD